MLIYENIYEEDYAELTTIMTEAFNADTRLHTNLQEDGPRGYNDGTLIRKLNTMPMFISQKVVLNGQIIGGYTVILEKERNILDMLYISPKISGQGIGTAIWNHIENTYTARSIWVVETPSYSKRNHHFYMNKCGFTFAGEKDYENDEKSYVFFKNITRDKIFIQSK